MATTSPRHGDGPTKHVNHSCADQLPEFGIGYIADVEQVGNGYVTEAVSAIVKELFENVKAHRIQIETDDTNARSIGVAERCGFVKEGHLRENKKHPDGTISGTLFYGLLKSENIESNDRTC